MAVSMIGPKFYAWNRDGKPLAFGKLYTYQARTNTPKPTYQSEDQVVENTNPVILNGEGYANVYLDGSYKMVLKDDKDNEIWSSDPVTSAQPDEWVNCFVASYVSPTDFKIQGNQTDQYRKDRKVRIDNNAAQYAYSTILTSVYASGETSITVSDPVVTTGILNVCTSITSSESSFNNEDIGGLSKYVSKNVEDMVDGVVISGDIIEHKVNQVWSSGGTTWKVISDTVPITIDSFFALDDICVIDFGAKGDGVNDDTASIQSAIDYASNRNAGQSGVFGGVIYLPAGTYKTTSQLKIEEDNVGIVGSGKSSIINYDGSTDSAIFMGLDTQASETFKRNQFIRDIGIKIVSKVDVISGIVLNNCIHFEINNVIVTGGGSPNEQIPLKGIGIHITKTSFIGRVTKADVRLFDQGIMLSTPGASTYESGWAAAIVIDGHSELHNNNIGLYFSGTGGNAASSSIGVKDITIEGNYQGGVFAKVGNNIVIDTVYFEANAGYNVNFESTVSSTIQNCNSVASPLLETPYGPVGFSGHFILQGGNTRPRVLNNNCAIQGGDFSSIVINSGCNSAEVKGNRVAGSPVGFDKIRDEASNSIIADNLGFDDLVWITPTLENSWSDVANRPVLEYAIDKRNSDRKVLFRGVIGGGSSGQKAFTLPSGFRPYDRLDFSGVNNNKITITSAGDVIPTAATSEVSFSGVRYDDPI